MSIKQQYQSLEQRLAQCDDPDSRAVEDLHTAIGNFPGVCQQFLDGCGGVDDYTNNLIDLICEGILVKHSVDQVSGMPAARTDKDVSLLTCTKAQQREPAGRLMLNTKTNKKIRKASRGKEVPRRCNKCAVFCSMMC